MTVITLNDKQITVLRWVADGCPDGVMDGYAHRVSAAALRSRGLVRVVGRGPTWRAELTERGARHLLGLASAPARPAGRNGSGREMSASTQGASDGRSSTSPKLSKTEQLVADVIAAGGTLTLPDDTARGGVNWRQRAYAAQRHGKVPDGKHLSVSWTSAGFVIELLDGATGNELGAEPVVVPARVGRYHRVAADFRGRTGLHEVSRTGLPRALRIVHSLALELERRGHGLACVQVREDRYGRSEWKPSRDGQLVATLGGRDFALRLREKGVGLRGPWEAQLKRREENRRELRFDRWDVGRIEPYDKGATGQLNLEILSWGSRQQAWGDRRRWRLEDRLAQALRELEMLAQEAEERRLAREREVQERRRQWELAMADAKRQALDAHRLEVLRRRVAAWEEGDCIRAYCAELEHRYGAQADDWIGYALRQADRLQRVPSMPSDPALGPEDLKPYLGPWSPYGPESRRW